MIKLYPEELLKVASRVIWFKPPYEGLKDPIYFLCYVMQFAVTEDILIVKKYFNEENFKIALNKAYPGILDKRSWAYWNLKILHTQNRPMPQRFQYPQYPKGSEL